LSCEHHVDPLGIGELCPRLSWQLPVTRRGVRQTAYELLVASSRELLERDEADVWQPGRVEGDDNVLVPYAGPPLASRARCHWKVRVWDEHDEPSDWSEPAWWEMTLLDPGDWTAQWIGVPRPPLERQLHRPAPLLRHEFRVDGPVARARLYASGLGLYRVTLNSGAFLSSDARPFAPGWTDYHRRVQFQTYDVTGALRDGDNAIGVALGEGWYAGLVGNVHERAFWGQDWKAIAQLEIDYADGRREVVCTDDAWRHSFGPIVVSDLLEGEIYDARAEQPGWDEPGFAADGWQPVERAEPPRGALVPERGRPTRRLQELAPVARTAPTQTMFVYDFGQNMAGRVRLKVQGKAGTEIMIRHGELLAPDGTVYTQNLRQAFATDRYVLKGDGVEVWEPWFTVHGFRYIEVWGHPDHDPPADAFTAIVIGAELDHAGSFHCSNEDLNALHECIVWTHRSNSIEVPTDDPSRHERNGWLGDAAVFARSASYVTKSAPFFEKYLVDVRDAINSLGAFPHFAPTTWPEETETRGWLEGEVVRPLFVHESSGSPGWGNGGVSLPWELYVMTGDLRMVQEHYDAMVRWVELLVERNPDLIWRNLVGNDYGDWLSVPLSAEHKPEPRVRSVYSTSPKRALSTAFLYRDATLVARFAKVLGRDDDAERFQALAERIGDAYRTAFVDDEGRIEGGTQTLYAQALWYGLVPQAMREQTAAHLEEAIHAADDHVSTGILGLVNLLPTLAACGRTELAYTLLLQEDIPGWIWMLRNGATTIWERWDNIKADGSLQDVQMNSFNQSPLGCVGQWLYETIAGISPDPDAPGFRRFHVRPQPGGGITSASATHVSPHGEIRCAWERDGDRFALDLVVPAGTVATLRLPAASGDQVHEGSTAADVAEGVRALGRDERAAEYEVAPGSYRFVVHANGTPNDN
jgi:alpha-L-rhamnosidase